MPDAPPLGTDRPVIIATRSSELALRQAHMVRDALLARGVAAELKTYTTVGDKRLEVAQASGDASRDGPHRLPRMCCGRTNDAMVASGEAGGLRGSATLTLSHVGK